MNARSSRIAALALVVALPGCLPTSWHSSPSTGSSSYPDPYGGTLDVQAGHQTGPTGMGEMGAYDAEATRLEGNHDSSSSYVQLDTVGPGYWVMTGFSFEQDIDSLTPGTTYYATSYYGSTVPPSTTPDAQPVMADVRGCSGPRDGDYTYDDLAQDATFQVEVLPSGLRRVHYTAVFVNDAGETQNTRGSFDY